MPCRNTTMKGYRLEPLLRPRSWAYPSHCTWLAQANLQARAWCCRSSWSRTNVLASVRLHKVTWVLHLPTPTALGPSPCSPESRLVSKNFNSLRFNEFFILIILGSRCPNFCNYRIPSLFLRILSVARDRKPVPPGLIVEKSKSRTRTSVIV